MMLVLLLCVIMKIAELSSGRTCPTLSRQPPSCCNNNKEKRRYLIRGYNINVKNIYPGRKRTGKGVAMMEDPQTPGSDCNSNPADPISQDLIGSEFIQDNSDYQWFIDYGYRDGSLHVHPSVLTSLSTSYNHDDFSYYDDLARNLDANLAEVDMESFRTADIHTLLTALPVMCTDPVQQSEGEDSACSTTDTISICKSSLLFSPVKETPVLPPGGSYSVDSLDCEDMLLTCQTNNKNNYTIAFEGSMTMYSDSSQEFDSQEKQKNCEPYDNRKIELKNILDLSMACSDSKIYTTWSNLKQSSSSSSTSSSSNNKAMKRHGSGNNNTTPNFLQSSSSSSSSTTTSSSREINLTNLNKKFLSLPDLRRPYEADNQKLTFDKSEKNNEQSTNSRIYRSVNSASNTSVVSKKLQNMSLVKLYMKQKSMSTEGMSLTLDQSDSASDNGWPTSNSESETPNTQINRHKNINNKPNIPDNDFSINWVKTPDCYKSDESSNNTSSSKRIPSIKEFKEESPSVDELYSSLGKSDVDLDNIVAELKKIKGSWTKSSESVPMFKSTGTQAITQMQENGVQTSLLYVLPPKNDFSHIRETLIDKKPVYVIYPNYVLPDLSFLKIKNDKISNNISLKPQGRTAWKRPGRNNRPFSCNDIDAVKQKGFSHVKDWESLTFLLPAEYRKVLHDVPEIPSHIKLTEEIKKPNFCLSPPMRNRSRTISDAMANNVSSSSSTGTQPSSGYRGSSTILTDSSSNQPSGNNQNPLYLYRYDSASSDNSITSQDKKLNCGKTLSKRSLSLPQGDSDTKIPPRPPLPRSILRKNRTSANKRYSMFDMGGGIEEIDDNNYERETNKRMSLQEPYFINNDIQSHMHHGKIIDSDKDVDEVEERRYAERMKEVGNYGIGNTDEPGRGDDNDVESSIDDIKQLEEFLKRSGLSSNSSDDNDDNDIKLRSYVKKFLSLKMNKDLKYIDMYESQKKTVSFAELNQRNNINDLINIDEKKKLLYPVNKSVDLLIKYWQSGTRDTYDKNECSKICLTNLCPALYAIMSDGLKEQLTSSFGPILNSVWHVIEVSSQQGPLTNTLNELVEKINSEDFMTEGMLKFHAFLFGLLNLRSLDAWFGYLCTRETILKKHYTNNSLFVSALSSANSRELVDNLLGVLQPLAFCPFQLDLFYQYRQLQNSFGNINSVAAALPRPRPRSCNYDDKRCKNDADSQLKKRWSNLTIGSKITYPILDKIALDDSEDYTDSLEHSPLNRANKKNQITNSPDKIKGGDTEDDLISGENKFRKLQEKWELMVGKDDTTVNQAGTSPNNTTNCVVGTSQKSKIPRLLTSPIKQPTTTSLLTGKTKLPVSGIKKPTPTSKLIPKKSTIVDTKTKGDLPKRTSRVDQEHAPVTRTHLTRPSSLPYKSYGPAAKEKNLISPQRRAASTSLPRPNTTPVSSRTGTTAQIKKPLKEVRTLTHRLPSDNGHLAFNEGDRLKVIFEVDNKWLLCAKGTAKGLVPRTFVHPYQT